MDTYLDEKNEGIVCVNYKCNFHDDTGVYEQNCGAGDEQGNPYLPYCERYIPERDGA